MSSPYRESATSTIECPRCGKRTASGEIIACIEGCGIWVSSEAAQTAFEASELAPSRIVSWFRTRVGCPLCSKQMTLRGHDMSLFQGCDSHGFWVDDSTITQTGLGRSSMTARLRDARDAAQRIIDERARPEREAREREAAARQRELDLEREAAERERAQVLERERAARERELAVAAEAKARELAAAAEKQLKREAEAKAAREAEQRKRQAAAEAAAREQVRIAEALEQRRQRELAEYEAKRAKSIERVNAAMSRGDSAPIVDELLRLEAMVREVVARVNDLDGK